MTETELRFWLASIAIGVWLLLAVISISMYFGYQDTKTSETPMPELPPQPEKQQYWKGKRPS